MYETHSPTLCTLGLGACLSKDSQAHRMQAHSHCWFAKAKANIVLIMYFFRQQINCAIIPREGSDIDEAEVLRFCKKNLAAFKVPKKVFLTDSLPKTATGKIQRRFVAEHFLAQISTAKVPKFGA